jgi:lysozyme
MPTVMSGGSNLSLYADSTKFYSKHYQIKGIDVSWHNGHVAWSVINQTVEDLEKIQFAFIKATEGTDFTDPQFKFNWTQSKANGFLRGAYHFYLVDKDPREQALNFLSLVKTETGDLLPVVDFESISEKNYSETKIASDLKQFIEIIETKTGHKPIIYTNTPLYKKIVNKYFSNYPVWLSEFNQTNLKSLNINKPVFWQYSESGSLRGLVGPVDLNVFLGSEHGLQKFIIQ